MADLESHSTTAREVALPASLEDVLNERCPLLHLPRTQTQADCSAMLNALSDFDFITYPFSDGFDDASPIVRLDRTPTVAEFVAVPDGFRGYFERAAHDMVTLRAAFASAGVIDPLDVLIRVLADMWPGTVEIATEPSGETYFAGVVQDASGGALPHTDNAAHETANLAVGRVRAQGSILFFLEGPEIGGALRVYHKRLNTEDRLANRLHWGFSPAAVRGTSFSGVIPATGDVAIFPTNLVHEIEPVQRGRRISISAFFGPIGDRLVVWS